MGCADMNPVCRWTWSIRCLWWTTWFMPGFPSWIANDQMVIQVGEIYDRTQIHCVLWHQERDLFQWNSQLPIKEALILVLIQSAMPWLWPTLTNRSLRVATPVDLRVGICLVSMWLPGIQTSCVRSGWPSSGMGRHQGCLSSSGIHDELPELPNSLTDHGNCQCWIQPVASWMVGGRTPFPT